MPEYEIAVVYKRWCDSKADAFEHGDLLATAAERHDPEISADVKVAEVNP